MASVTGKIVIRSMDGSQPPPATPGKATAVHIEQDFNCSFGTPGTLADRVDQWSIFTLHLAAAPQTIDLTALVDVYTQPVNMKRVRRLVILPQSTADADTLTISPGASNGWTALVSGNLTLRAKTAVNDAGAIFAAPSATAWATDSTHRTLKFDPGSASFDVSVEIMGASA